MKFKTKQRTLSAVLAMIITLSTVSPPVLAQSNLVAFPGAEGGGMYTQGARAGDEIEVYHVTNLNDSGAGSFRDAVSQGNRIIVFDVAGTIMLESELIVRMSNLTILGQTAPGEGICIGGESVQFKDASEIILRYLRFRMGDKSTSEEDGLGIRGGKNIIVDHCSISWSVDECLSMYENMNTTVQNCIISESLTQSVHTKGSHGYGGIWGGINASFHHNLLASHDSRNPRIGTSFTVRNYQGSADTDNLIDIRNNVIYNWGQNSSYGGENGVRVNIVNNYYKPSDKTEHTWFYEVYGGNDNLSSTLHLSGNVLEGSNDLSENNWLGVHNENNAYTWTKCESISDGITTGGAFKANDEFIYDYPVTTTSANDAYNYVLENVGANIYRDSIDQRVINDVINSTYPTGSKGSTHLIDSQEDVGGWISLHGVKPLDSDNDGMSDEWESANGLNPNLDDSTAMAENGYCNLENYANYLAASTYSGYEVDTEKLEAKIKTAEKFDELDYTAEDWAELQRVLAAAKDVLNLSAPTQEQVDEAYNNLHLCIEDLVIDHTVLLENTIEKANAIDKTNYSYETVKILNEAVAKAESDLSALNKAEYDNDIAAIDEAIAGLKTSLKPELNKIIKFLSAMDLSKITSSGRDYINSQIDKAKAVYDNAEALDADINRAIDDAYNIIALGNYELANKGKVVEVQNFEDENIYDNGYSFYARNGVDFSPNAEVLQGYGTNATKVMKTQLTRSSYDVIMYGKTIDTKLRHFIISYDTLFTSSTPEYFINIKLNGDVANYLRNAWWLSSKNKYSYAYADKLLKQNIWYNIAAEVDLDNKSVVYYINNAPVLTDTISGSKFTGFETQIKGVGSTILYYDNFKIVDLSQNEYHITGDCNNDGILTAADSAELLQRILKVDELTELEKLLDSNALKYIDMDCSGWLTSNDCALILAKVSDSSFTTPADEINTTESTTESTTETTTEIPTSGTVEYKTKEGTFYFNIDSGIIIDFDTATDSEIELVIPADIYGYKVNGIDYAAFEYCSALKKVTIPGSIENFGIDIFYGCSNLESVVLEEGITALSNGMFSNCYALTSISFPSTIKTLGKNTFASCLSFAEFSVPEGVETIGDSCFASCNGIKKLFIPRSVTSIAADIGARKATIYCYEGSYAETYAIEKNIPYELIQ